ncbi:hypothetical protein A9267_13910 [Shewanella sp. UCD-FRSSP16_17]|uniref:helix-turn-helix transcriptional regulator n=1 Tax=Shewanella sp. UCD-FRSSP16_17 TaxID=1853256 RepID=UPI0007EEDF74|nr:response regulator transcription factor [Shewanella sp. UCD-FRSSP16_17]OBT06971.1 hypothetical protein A9267_13910 [Shewanella sp. UCD-FRSSP16_17]
MIVSDIFLGEIPESLTQQLCQITELLKCNTISHDPLNLQWQQTEHHKKILLHYVSDPKLHIPNLSAELLADGKHLAFCPQLTSDTESLLIANGFHGGLSFDASIIEIIEAFKNLDNNKLYFSHDAMSHYIQSRNRQPITQRQTELLSLTTKKEQQVLSLVCQGLSNEQIAANLSISINTVKMHIQNIFKKTNVSSRGQLSYVFTQV